MKKMILTFDWIDNGRGKSILADEREFTVKDEADVQKDIVAWVKEMYKADNGKHENFEVCRGTKWELRGCGLHTEPSPTSIGLSTSCPGR